MSAKRVGFIGGGRIAKVFLGGWSRAGAMPGEVTVFDSDADAVTKLAGRFDAVRAGSLEEAAGQDVVFLAVHPPVIGSVLPQIAQALRPGAVLVSLAPKFTAAKLSELLGGFKRIVRVIPNAASIVCRGYNPTAFGSALGPQERGEIRQMLDALGECEEVPEEQLEIYAVVAAQGLTYFWPQIDMLFSLAESAGLSRAAAFKGLEGMLMGAVATLRDSGLTAAEVQDLVPARPLADEVGAFVGAARPKLEGVLAKLRS